MYNFNNKIQIFLYYIFNPDMLYVFSLTSDKYRFNLLIYTSSLFHHSILKSFQSTFCRLFHLIPTAARFFFSDIRCTLSGYVIPHHFLPMMINERKSVQKDVRTRQKSCRIELFYANRNQRKTANNFVKAFQKGRLQQSF